MSRDIFAAAPSFRRLLYSSLFGLARIMPVPGARLIGYLLGLLAWVCDRNGKKTVYQNIHTLMPEIPDSSLQRMVRKVYTNFGISTSELLLIPRLSAKHFADTRVLDPFNNIPEKPARGPLIGVTVHCNWEMMSCALYHLGYFKQCHAITLSHDDPHINDLFRSIRESMGVQSLLLDRAPLETLRTLKAGGILALLGDRDYTQHGMVRRIGGGNMKIPIGPAALAVQTQAPIVPVITARSGGGRYTILFCKAIIPDPTLSKKEQIPILLDQLAIVYERALRSVPSQWISFHPAFTQNESPS